MPIFEYECPKHGRFEKLQKEFTEGSICPECGRLSPKVMSRVSIKPKAFRGTNQGEWQIQNSIREQQEIGRV